MMTILKPFTLQLFYLSFKVAINEFRRMISGMGEIWSSILLKILNGGGKQRIHENRKQRMQFMA